jgi:hypothetical protein
MRILKVLVLSLLLGLLCACAVQVINPGIRVEPPEIRGDRGLIIDVEGENAHIYRATDDGSDRPPDLTHPTLHKTPNVSPSILYSPVEEFAFGLELGPIVGSIAGIAKVQLTGEGHRAAATGDVPVGLYLRAGRSSNEDRGDNDRLGDGHSWNGKAQTYFAHLGASAGYRFSEHSLLYLGTAYGHYSVSATVTQEKTSSDAGGTYKSSDNGNGVAVGLGMQFNWTHFLFFLGCDYTHIDYKTAGTMDDLNPRAGISISPR